MILKLDIASSVRLGLAVLLIVATVGSACLTLLPAPAFAGEMTDPMKSGQQHETDDCCSTESLQQVECCSQAPATASSTDSVSTLLPAQQLVVAPQNCCDAGTPVRLAGPPPAASRPPLPLRL